MIHRISLKVGYKFSMWQYKSSGASEQIIVFSGMGQILDGTCQLLGFDYADRSAIYEISFSDDSFSDCQVTLGRLAEEWDGYGMGCHYKVINSRIGTLEAEGMLPSILKDNYLKSWPEIVCYRLDRSRSKHIVN